MLIKCSSRAFFHIAARDREKLFESDDGVAIVRSRGEHRAGGLSGSQLSLAPNAFGQQAMLLGRLKADAALRANAPQPSG